MWKLGQRPRNSFTGNTYLGFSLQSGGGGGKVNIEVYRGVDISIVFLQYSYSTLELLYNLLAVKSPSVIASGRDPIIREKIFRQLQIKNIAMRVLSSV
jgi:hypothetical protein